MAASLARVAPGITVVEVLVALMLVSVGLLGIAGSSALSLRVVGEAAREREAVRRAADRIARLQASGCATAMSGEAAGGPAAVRERWIVAERGAGLLQVVDSVQWSSNRGTRTFVLVSAIPC